VEHLGELKHYSLTFDQHEKIFIADKHSSLFVSNMRNGKRLYFKFGFNVVKLFFCATDALTK
jgi:hypothetical protein